MNINNLFSGIMGLVVAIALIYWFWNPIVTLIGALDTNVQIALSVSAVIFVFMIVFFSPIGLASSDD